MKRPLALLALASVLPLGACSSGPSKPDEYRLAADICDRLDFAGMEKSLGTKTVEATASSLFKSGDTPGVMMPGRACHVDFAHDPAVRVDVETFAYKDRKIAEFMLSFGDQLSRDDPDALKRLSDGHLADLEVDKYAVRSTDRNMEILVQDGNLFVFINMSTERTPLADAKPGDAVALLDDLAGQVVTELRKAS